MEQQTYEDTNPFEPSNGGGGGFFERERARLIGDISKVKEFPPSKLPSSSSFKMLNFFLLLLYQLRRLRQGVESILGNSNVLNRKLEESISVGKEFHPISQLWSKFEKVMLASGIPNLHPQPPSTTNTTTTTTTDEKQLAPDTEKLKFDTHPSNGFGSTLPPGVAPGGGRIYN